jgi:hypothetical protein
MPGLFKVWRGDGTMRPSRTAFFNDKEATFPFSVLANPSRLLEKERQLRNIHQNFVEKSATSGLIYKQREVSSHSSDFKAFRLSSSRLPRQASSKKTSREEKFFE